MRKNNVVNADNVLTMDTSVKNITSTNLNYIEQK